MTGSSWDIDVRQRRRGAAALLLLFGMLACLGGRLVFIRAAWGSELQAKAEQQQASRAIIPARRGMILDVRSRVLASSGQCWDVFVDPALTTDVDATAAALSACLGMDPVTMAEQIRSRAYSRYVVVASCVGESEVAVIKELGDPAVGLTERGQRTYPLGSSMAHVIGFVGQEYKGLEGIELAYDEHLRGEDGVRATIRDARRRALWRTEELSRTPVDGGHVVLTIDAEIQRIAEEALESGIKEASAESGVAIVMSPKTGDVLAMACWPTFNLANGADTPAPIRRNRAVTDPVEPGSTFKPFIASGALAKAFVSPREEIDCHDGLYFSGKRRLTDTTPHGKLTLKGIVSKSSNIGMAIVGERMGAAALHEVLESFGFGALTGIECPGEHSGVVYPLRRWTRHSVTSIPMGYEILTTPIQLITAFSAILNDGVLLEPRLVRGLLSCDGSAVEWGEGPRSERRVLPAEVARYMSRVILVAVIEEGTGKKARLPTHQVLGKSGTAKLTRPDRRGYEPGAYLASFLGAAPAHDPVVAVLVMIRRPDASKAYYGGSVSAPVVREILYQVLGYLQVPADTKVASAVGG